MTTAQVIAGTKAKLTGHENEQKICKWLNLTRGGKHVVDGRSQTKRDIINEEKSVYYGLKSVTSNHTHCHISVVHKWCEHFNISGELKEWYDLFFGIPHEDVSNGTSRQHRLTKSQIDSHLNDIAVKWFNDNKLEIFDIIVRRGLYNTPIDYQIWHHKPTDGIEIHSIDELEKLVYNGNWVMNETTLWFIDSNGKKLFHLQMKGSGKKYVSGYHAMMFHIYKTL